MGRSFIVWGSLVGIFFGAQAIVLFLMGQPLICACGYVSFWHGIVLSPGNSQHLTDWYTFSHIIHGFGFYFLGSLLFPRALIGARLLFLVGLEASWEILENSDIIINRYRETALAEGYFGDSVINSICDTLVAAFGFFLAWRLPIWAIVGIAIFLEAFTLVFIRDNLALNTLMLLYPVDTINQ